ncbi:MAG: hypothetical protein FJZ56_03530 [Chlamydiae bacterium]|nr:hypothetical protein [Chlamydiota bacterium]
MDRKDFTKITVKFILCSMKILAIIFATYALLVAIGGVMGWVKAFSLISLLAGLSSSLVLLIFGHFLYREKKWALIASTITVFLLSVMFLIRFLKTGNFLPGGLMVLTGIPLCVLGLVNMRKHT